MDTDLKFILKIIAVAVALLVACFLIGYNYTFASTWTYRGSDGTCWVYREESKGNHSTTTVTPCVWED